MSDETTIDLTIEETLIYYDGPLFVTARDRGNRPYLAVAIDMADDHSLTWAAVRVESGQLPAFLDNRVEVRRMFTDHALSPALTGTFDHNQTAPFTPRAPLGDDELPAPGIHLHPDHA